MRVPFNHPAPGTRNPEPGTHRSVPSSQSQFQAPSTQHQILNPKSKVHWVVPPYLIPTATPSPRGRDP